MMTDVSLAEEKALAARTMQLLWRARDAIAGAKATRDGASDLLALDDELMAFGFSELVVSENSTMRRLHAEVERHRALIRDVWVELSR